MLKPVFVFLLIVLSLNEIQSCTVENGDPYGTGEMCCDGLDECLKDWNNNGNYFYLCVEIGCCDTACDATSEEEPILDVPRTVAATKRGIALADITVAQLAHLDAVVSWGYSWQPLPGASTVNDWINAGIEWIPMIWGTKQMPNIGDVPQGSIALLGFNEPNFVSQSDMTPQEAATLWPQLETEASEKGIPIIVSPAVNFSPDVDPIVWLDEFFDLCTGCQVDVLAIHSYTCYVDYLKSHIANYEKYGKTIWITEIACHDSVDRRNLAGQKEYMLELIPYLEGNDLIGKYAWFSYDFDGAEASLVNEEGLTELGQFYKQLIGDPYQLNTESVQSSGETQNTEETNQNSSVEDNESNESNDQIDNSQTTVQSNDDNDNSAISMLLSTMFYIAMSLTL